MIRTGFLLFVYLSLPLWAVAAEPVTTILFGSCIKQEKPMPLLAKMVDEQADITIFLGDNIYADTDDMDLMREKYAKLAANADFQKLITTTKVFTTWDDHDYGLNDGGNDFPKRQDAQRVFMDFWKVPQDSERRKQPGVYYSEILGPVGQRVQILMLDTRYFRSPLKKGEVRRVGGPYLPDSDPEKTMLGEAQWNWLKRELLKPAEVRIIGSSIQLLATDSGQETWANLPGEQARFYELVKQTRANGVFVVSGDRHWSEFSRVANKLAYPLYDFTSSSINQLHPRGTPTENAHRLIPTTYHRENYGKVTLDWKENDVELLIEVKDLSGKAVMEHRLRGSELSF